MRSRQIFHPQPEPGKKPSSRHSEFLRKIEKMKPQAAALSATAGFSAAFGAHLLRMKQMNEEIGRRNKMAQELGRLNSSDTGTRGNSAYASNTEIDNFIESTRADMVNELREGISASDALILEMESDAAGASFVEEGCFFTAAFAAAMVLGIFALKGLAAREGRKAALAKKQEEGAPDRGRRIVKEMESPAHSQTEIPAPAPQPEKFTRPGYYDVLFLDLKKSIREEMGALGSEEAAEAFLCVMPRKEVEELLNWPETIAVHIDSNRDRLREFLQERKIDPRHLFARLGPEVTGLF